MTPADTAACATPVYFSDAYRDCFATMTTDRTKAASEKPRIVFVDDTRALLDVVEPMLAALGCAPATFADAAAAIRFIDSHAVALVITDLSMPDISGVELIQRVRACDGELPIAITSGAIDAARQEDYLSLGVCAILYKPFSIDDLARVLEAGGIRVQRR